MYILKKRRDTYLEIVFPAVCEVSNVGRIESLIEALVEALIEALQGIQMG